MPLASWPCSQTGSPPAVEVGALPGCSAQISATWGMEQGLLLLLLLHGDSLGLGRSPQEGCSSSPSPLFEGQIDHADGASSG